MALPKFIQKQTHLILKKKKNNKKAQLIKEFDSKSDNLNSITSTQIEDIIPQIIL